MSKHYILMAVASLALAAGEPLNAAPQDDVDALRVEFEQKFKALQADYEARLKSLESRVQAAETQADQATQTASRATPTAQQRTKVAASVAGRAFNPEISLILQGAYIDRTGGERP
ncbi:MAG: hypothetical protein WBC62_09910, partial [Candidatus Macondimonas sp.]